MYVLVGVKPNIQIIRKHCALGARAQKERKPTNWRPPGWNSELYGVLPVFRVIFCRVQSRKRLLQTVFLFKVTREIIPSYHLHVFSCLAPRLRAGTLNKLPWATKQTRSGENSPYCPQTTWAGCYGSRLKTIRAPFLGLKSTLDKVSLSVPEQSVPGGLAVQSASSRLQVTGVSSRTAVLWVRAAHSLSKHQIRLD